MLNELYDALQGMNDANIEPELVHQSIAEAGKRTILVITMSEHEPIVSLDFAEKDLSIWTLRDGQKNSFPCVNSPPLLNAKIPPDDKVITSKGKQGDTQLIHDAPLNNIFASMTTPGYRARLEERYEDIVKTKTKIPGLDGLLLTFELTIALLKDPKKQAYLMADIRQRMLNIYFTPESNHPDKNLAFDILIGKWDKKHQCYGSSGALLFNVIDSQGFPIYHREVKTQLSKALQFLSASKETHKGTCILSGEQMALVSGNFSQPKLPEIGQVYLFARNKDTEAHQRYKRSSAQSIAIGQNIDLQLAGSLRWLTEQERKGLTWGQIRRNSSNGVDLLIAYVKSEQGLSGENITVVKHLTNDFDSEEETNELAIALFEKSTEQIFTTLKAKSSHNITKIPVNFLILRKVDPGNTKVIYSNKITVDNLYESSKHWIRAERNSFFKKPRHLAPLSFIPLSKTQYESFNSKKQNFDSQELNGLKASEALNLFLNPNISINEIHRILNLFLQRRKRLLEQSKESAGYLRKQQTRIINQTVTIFSILLYKLNRRKEQYMTGIAFKLGQLLAAADMLHAGYCHDVRKGSLPSSLLGNQYLVLAQKSPAKALSSLAQRWKPYSGWARKAMADSGRIQALINSDKKSDQDKGWAIRVACSQCRAMQALTPDIAADLTNAKVDDIFKAELLLGYIHGLPTKKQQEQETTETQ